MAIAFDPSTKRIILDSTSATISDVWIAWSNWVTLSDNAKYLPALKQVGGDDLGSGLLIPLYFFLLNNWRVRPMESNHNLTLIGNLFVDGGGVPVVQTLGVFQVNVNYTVPVQAQAVSTGSGSSATPEQIAQAVHDYMLEAGKSFQEMMRIQYAVLAGKVNGAGTSSEKFRDIADTKDRLVSVVDEFGNRTSITVDGN